MKLFARQLYFELLKLFARKRTYFGFGAFLAMESIILLLLQTRGAQRAFTRSMTQAGLDFSHYFSGLTLAYVMLSSTVFVLGSLYVALVCGDIVSKEVEDGTLRMMLCRPITRIRILLLKYLACVFYTVSLTIFIVSSSLLLGIAERGTGGLIVVAPWDGLFAFYECGPGLWHFLIATGVLCYTMVTLSSLGFMCSCLNMKPASATVLTLSLYIADTVVRNVPYFQDIKGYFLSGHMGEWTQAFQPTIPWHTLSYSMLYLGAFDILFIVIGAITFSRRDFKS
jgi:ABC-2 type transport system permease protein